MARLLFTSRNFGSLSDPIDITQSKALAKLVGKPIQFMQQTHSNNILVVDSVNNIVEDTDSLITSDDSVALAVRVADCIPLLLYSSKLVAAVHVGRKGLLNNVAQLTIQKMQSLGALEITGVVGPHICGDCYEVDEKMANEIHATHPATAGKARHLNLFNGLQAQLPGISLSNMNICTKENYQYFSFRANNESGRQVGVISR